LEQRYGSLINGQIRGARERSQQQERSRQSAASFSFREGMQTMTNALARAVSVRLSSKVLNVRRCDDGAWTVAMQTDGGVTHMRSRAVVLAVPAYEAAPLVQPYSPAAARALAEITYAPVASVASVYSREHVAHPLDGYGLLAPRVERRRILGTLFSSSMFEHRSPADKVLVTTFLGGQRDPQLAGLPDDEIMRVIREELSDLIGARGSPHACTVSRWPRAIPQYVLGHLERIRFVHEAELASPGLFLCASYRGGVAVGDCIKSAHACATAVAAHVAHIDRA
ncbi:MAG TPA: protoporphyrinogen oxidase, partial [Burkholderiales bacterium]|nr:protoporphyrinogen oxidase [Burkholderiales bacterium]